MSTTGIQPELDQVAAISISGMRRSTYRLRPRGCWGEVAHRSYTRSVQIRLPIRCGREKVFWILEESEGLVACFQHGIQREQSAVSDEEEERLVYLSTQTQRRRRSTHSCGSPHKIQAIRNGDPLQISQYQTKTAATKAHSSRCIACSNGNDACDRASKHRTFYTILGRHQCL